MTSSCLAFVLYIELANRNRNLSSFVILSTMNGVN